jgi:hypothetical protein
MKKVINSSGPSSSELEELKKQLAEATSRVQEAEEKARKSEELCLQQAVEAKKILDAKDEELTSKLFLLL